MDSKIVSKDLEVKFWSQFIHWGLRYRAASIFQLQKRLQNRKCPSVSQSISLSVCLSQIPLSLSESCLSAKSQPISAYQHHNHLPSCLSAIMPIWPSDLCHAFATLKPFRLVLKYNCMFHKFSSKCNSLVIQIISLLIHPVSLFLTVVVAYFF